MCVYIFCLSWQTHREFTVLHNYDLATDTEERGTSTRFRGACRNDNYCRIKVLWNCGINGFTLYVV